MLRFQELDGDLYIRKCSRQIGRIVKVAGRYIVKLDDATILHHSDLRELANKIDELYEPEIQRYLDLPYSYCFKQGSDGTWFAYVKELEGCASQGNTLEDAFEMIKDAMSGWLLVCLEDGDFIPEPDESGRAW